jgi:hypothetical protein
MFPITFIFEVDGIKSEFAKEYKEEPTKEQVVNDIANWFFQNHYMWFAIKKNGKEINLEDFI